MNRRNQQRFNAKPLRRQSRRRVADRVGPSPANEISGFDGLSPSDVALIQKGFNPAMATAKDGKPTRFLRMPEVERRTGYGRRHIYRMIAEGQFPKSRRRSHRIAVWYETEVEAWQLERIVADLLS